MKKLVLSVVLLAALAACAKDPLPDPMPFTGELPPKIGLDVQNIVLVDRASSDRVVSIIDPINFTPTLGAAVRQWAVDRLQATGANGQAVVTIKEAKITVEPLPVSAGPDVWFTRQQSTRYVGHIVAEVAVRRGSDYGVATAEATRWVSLPEDPDTDERKEAYFTLLNSLMRDLGTNLEGNIQRHLNRFLPVQPNLYAPVVSPTPAATVIPLSSTVPVVTPMVQPVAAPVVGTMPTITPVMP